MKLTLSLYAIFLILIPSSALAYIDAGSGSMLLQLLLAGVASAAVMLKLCWHRIKDLLKRKKHGE